LFVGLWLNDPRQVWRLEDPLGELEARNGGLSPEALAIAAEMGELDPLMKELQRNTQSIQDRSPSSTPDAFPTLDLLTTPPSQADRASSGLGTSANAPGNALGGSGVLLGASQGPVMGFVGLDARSDSALILSLGAGESGEAGSPGNAGSDPGLAGNGGTPTSSGAGNPGAGANAALGPIVPIVPNPATLPPGVSFPASPNLGANGLGLPPGRSPAAPLTPNPTGNNSLVPNPASGLGNTGGAGLNGNVGSVMPGTVIPGAITPGAITPGNMGSTPTGGMVANPNLVGLPGGAGFDPRSQTSIRPGFPGSSGNLGTGNLGTGNLGTGNLGTGNLNSLSPSLTPPVAPFSVPGQTIGNGQIRTFANP